MGTVGEEERLYLLQFKADLLHDLASEGLLKTLTRFDSTTWQAPFAGEHTPTVGHLAQQVLASQILNHANDNEAAGCTVSYARHASLLALPRMSSEHRVEQRGPRFLASADAVWASRAGSLVSVAIAWVLGF